METKISTTTQSYPVSKYKAYQVWNDIMQRCYNPKSQRYSSYGARGIMVCYSWLSFREFLADMGERPDGFSIDRKDVNLDYTPENCRWIPLKLQAQNRRTTLWVDMGDGRKICAAEAARELGVNEGTIRYRIKRRGSIYGTRKWTRKFESRRKDV